MHLNITFNHLPLTIPCENCPTSCTTQVITNRPVPLVVSKIWTSWSIISNMNTVKISGINPLPPCHSFLRKSLPFFLCEIVSRKIRVEMEFKRTCCLYATTAVVFMSCYTLRKRNCYSNNDWEYTEK